MAAQYDAAVASVLVSGVTAAAVTATAMPVVLRFLTHRQVFDLPNERSSHQMPTPRGGGLAQVLGTLAGIVLGSLTGLAAVLPALPILAFPMLGAADDHRTISARARLAVQLVAGAVLSVGILTASVVAPVTLWVGVLLGTVFVAATVNAVNFMDGINGIAALNGLVMSMAFAFALTVAGAPAPWPVVAAAMAGASLAFLPWNLRRHARVFMGDVGSYLLGAVTATLVIATWASTSQPIVAIAPLAIIATDTGVTFARRIATGNHPFEAHREHVYQRLVRGGLPHPVVAVIVAMFTLATSLLGLAVQAGTLPWAAALTAIVALCLCYLALPRIVQSRAQAAS